MPLSPEQIAKVRADSGAAPLPAMGASTGKSLLSQLGLDAKEPIENPAAIADKKSAEVTGASFPADTAVREGVLSSGTEAALKSTGNVPSSLLNFVKGLYSAVKSPVQTIKGAGQAVAGAASEAGRALGTGANVGKPKTDEEDVFGKVADALKERYGSLEAAERTAVNDPLGFGADVLTILSAGAGAATKVPALASTVSKIEKAVQPVVTTIAKPVTALAEKTGSALKKSAEVSIGKVLNPTKEAMKESTLKILPELTSRRKIAFTQKGLAKQYAAERELAGREIDEAWKALPEGTRENITPIIDGLEQSKQKFVVDGTIIEPNAFQAADELQKLILKVAKESDNISSESLRRIRQIWDETVDSSNGFTRDLSDQSKLAIKKEATNAIRKVLADAHPDIAKLNSEYSLWANAQDILDETIRRNTGRDLSRDVKTSAGIGLIAGAGAGKATIMAAALAAVVAATKSTAWRTISAAVKSKLAEALMSGNSVEVKSLLIPIVGEQALSGLAEIKEEGIEETP